jgi:hypothetical protein
MRFLGNVPMLLKDHVRERCRRETVEDEISLGNMPNWLRWFCFFAVGRAHESMSGCIWDYLIYIRSK